MPFREQRRLVRADGEEALVFLSASVLRGPDGSPRYYVTSAEDVSDKHDPREPAAVPGDPRPAHRPGQPAPVPRPARGVAARQRQGRRADRLPRGPGRLPRDQQRHGPRRRRPAAGHGRRPAARDLRGREGHDRAVRGRRVRRAAGEHAQHPVDREHRRRHQRRAGRTRLRRRGRHRHDRDHRRRAPTRPRHRARRPAAGDRQHAAAAQAVRPPAVGHGRRGRRTNATDLRYRLAASMPGAWESGEIDHRVPAAGLRAGQEHRRGAGAAALGARRARAAGPRPVPAGARRHRARAADRAVGAQPCVRAAAHVDRTVRRRHAQAVHRALPRARRRPGPGLDRADGAGRRRARRRAAAARHAGAGAVHDRRPRRGQPRRARGPRHPGGALRVRHHPRRPRVPGGPAGARGEDVGGGRVPGRDAWARTRCSPAPCASS